MLISLEVKFDRSGNQVFQKNGLIPIRMRLLQWGYGIWRGSFN